MAHFSNTTYCGTAHCIAGWALVLVGEGEMLPTGLGRDIVARASEHLDISEGDARGLFFTTSWPEEFEDRYIDASSVYDRAGIAVERIRAFMEHKGATNE
jgi:hypothetical protein